MRIAIGLAALLLASCSGLGGEPLIVSTQPPPAPTQAAVPPTTPPDIAHGAAVFAARCTRCHGVGGAGDGELVRTGEVMNAGNFRDPASARGQRPTEWYSTVTNGRIERLMPPWSRELDQDSRWAVALYTYTLHYTSEQVARGRDLFAASCAECHGTSGRGDGDRAAESGYDVPNLTDPASLMTLSDQNLFTIITEGHGEAMEGFAASLSDDERWSVAAYVRTFALANPDAIAVQVQSPAETEEPSAAAAVMGSVRGQVTNGTAGGSTPSGLPVTLIYLDKDLNQFTAETTTDSAGAFSFDNIPLSREYRYAAAANYRERTFVSQVVDGAASGDLLELPIAIYELTEDPAVITITGTVAQINAIGDSLEITQVFTLRNNSDRAFSTSRSTPDGRPISAAIALPPGAVVLGFPENENRYSIAQEQFTILDTLPVLPEAEHIIAVVYIVPYTGGALIEQPLNYAFAGPARVLLRPLTITLRSEQLTATGVETIGQSEWQGFGASVSLSAGETLRYELSGAAQSVSTRSSEGVVTSNNLIPLIICAVVAEIALMAGLFMWFRRRRQRRARANAASAGDSQLIDGLIRQIAELDAQYERGDIDAEAYNRQRTALKTRLTELLN
jgi:mono/diheme cytochrome c family protein